MCKAQTVPCFLHICHSKESSRGGSHAHGGGIRAPAEGLREVGGGEVTAANSRRLEGGAARRHREECAPAVALNPSAVGRRKMCTWIRHREAGGGESCHRREAQGGATPAMRRPNPSTPNGEMEMGLLCVDGNKGVTVKENRTKSVHTKGWHDG